MSSSWDDTIVESEDSRNYCETEKSGIQGAFVVTLYYWGERNEAEELELNLFAPTRQTAVAKAIKLLCRQAGQAYSLRAPFAEARAVVGKTAQAEGVAA